MKKLLFSESKIDKEEWHEWYAWRPVIMREDGKYYLVFRKKIMRRYIIDFHFLNHWEYKEMGVN